MQQAALVNQRDNTTDASRYHQTEVYCTIPVELYGSAQNCNTGHHNWAHNCAAGGEPGHTDLMADGSPRLSLSSDVPYVAAVLCLGEYAGQHNWAHSCTAGGKRGCTGLMSVGSPRLSVSSILPYVTAVLLSSA